MRSPQDAQAIAAMHPNHWGRLIDAGHMHPAPIQVGGLLTWALRGRPTLNVDTTTAITISTSLLGASIILSHSIAGLTGCDSARDVYDECRRVASILDNRTPGGIAHNNPDAMVDAAYAIINTYNSDALTWMLVDIIRIANHITEN